uniref:BZIP domain-containing protein n=1 Tax=Entomoneis paludosa TaxID=265537 RepID=A0A7S2Y626_9STRA|mmetsp:Transcript_13012/g.27014  ORF Transcript_13012/g.27014 Transcript_13012/m.27014 type:complete len:357 (+) Transcript_13012:135-1205(+)
MTSIVDHQQGSPPSAVVVEDSNSSSESMAAYSSADESTAADTRKRPLDVTTSATMPESTGSSNGSDHSQTLLDASEQPPRKRRVSADSEAIDKQNIKIPQANPIVKCISKPGKITKKPQMKYDPDVPMTKEQAAVWRREQRRKRNRESAAASRQRQRDRINELESEVEQWKVKYDQIMRQVCDLEQMSGHAPHPASPALSAREVFGGPHHPPHHHHPHHHHHAHHHGVPPPPPMMRGLHPRAHSPEHEHRGTSTPTYHTTKKIISPRMHTPMSHHHRRDEYIHRTASVSPYASPAPQDDSSSDEHEGHIIEYRNPSKRHSEYKLSTKISSRPAMSRINHLEHPSHLFPLPVQPLTA